MTPIEFKPGFRISPLDAGIIAVAGIVSTLAWQWFWWLGFTIAFVFAHFFLFCNVFRIARIPELIWAVVFASLAGATIVTGMPGWIATATVSVALSIVLIALEAKKPSYHGVAWRKINPRLPDWWESQFAK